jgi:hypothetical protein
MIAWGSADDIAASPWAVIQGTPSVTTGYTDPFGGTGGQSIVDNDAGLAAYRGKAFTAATALVWVTLAIRKISGTEHNFGIDRASDGTWVHQVRNVWQGSQPVLSSQSGVGIGTILSPVDLGNALWWLVMFSANVTAGTQYRLLLGGGAGTSETAYYLRNIVLLDYLGTETVAYPRPRDGSEIRRFPSGSQDAWYVGTDEVLSAAVRSVPLNPRGSPVIVSGWDGPNETTGVNAGVRAMLTAGRQGTVLRFVPDRSVATGYNDSYLLEPLRDPPEVASRGSDLDFRLELVSTTAFTGI